MVPLLAIHLALTQTPQPRLFLQPNLPRGQSNSLAFVFAPAGGTGMGTACSGASITGSRGQAITVTRASARSCLKGGETSGIANGDLVDLTSGQPAVQPGGTGSGALGINTFEARTNTVLRNKEMDNAVWNPFGSGGASAPTVTANAATAPDGTATAERLQIPATTATQRSLLYQDSSCEAGLNAISCFVRGVSGSGTTDLAVDDGAAGWISVSCPFVSTSWTRCYAENVLTSTTGANFLFAIGNMSLTNGGVARSASDIYVSRCQCELGGSLGPSIPTVGSAVSTVKDLVTASYTASGPSVSVGGALAPASLVWDNMNIVSLSSAATTETVLTTVGTKNSCNVRLSDTGHVLEGLNNMLTPVRQSASCGYAPAAISVGDGTSIKSSSGALVIPTGAATIYIGGLSDGGVANGTVSEVCVGSTQCRAGTPVSCPATPGNSQTVANIGDSIMVGGFAQKVDEEMQDRLCSRGIGVVSYAVSGAKIVDCALQYHTSVKGQGYRQVATNCGVNDILAGTSGASAWASMESLVNDITQDGGYFLILGNLTPCGGNVSCDTTRLTDFNTLEAAWCADAGPARATCLDNFTLLGLGLEPLTFQTPLANRLASTCTPSVDALHPNNICTTKLADAFAGAVP